MKKPDLFEFLDVHLFLKETYKFKKFKIKDFSYDLWAQELGFKSRGHLRSIIIGEAKLTDNLIVNFVDGLNLTDDEADYFTLLTKYSTAESVKTKETFARALIPIWRTKVHGVQVQDIAEFLSDSIIPVVFTYLSFEDVSSEIAQISQKLNCDEDRIQKAIKCLVWQKLVDGSVSASGSIKYKTIQPYFNIPTLPNNNYLKHFHLEGLKIAEVANDLPSDTRKFYSTFVALSADQFAQAQKIIQDCNQKILALFDQPTLNDRNIYRLNTQIFPVSNLSQNKAISDSAEPQNEL